MPDRNPPKITFVERKYWKKDGLAFSIEKVFAEIARSLRGYSTSFVKLPYGNGFSEMIRNLLFFQVPESDVYHVTGQVHHIALRLPPSRTVLTVHDLGFLNNRSGIRRFLPRVTKSNPASLFVFQAITALPSSNPASTCPQM